MRQPAGAGANVASRNPPDADPPVPNASGTPPNQQQSPHEPPMSVRMLALPFFRNHWVYHAWVEGQRATPAAAARAWHEGSTIQERFQILGDNVSSKVRSNVSEQWRSVETAEEGTFKNRLYKLAKFVLSREDPLESFFKSIPKDCKDAQILYPAGLPASLVRRRTRKLANLRIAYHQRRMIGWALTAIPQAPLALTPLPNVTVYYSVYKVISHYQACNGARALANLFKQSDAHQMHQMYEVVAELARSGHKFPPGSWPDKLLRKDERYMDLQRVLEHKARQQLGLSYDQLPVQPRLVPDSDLDAIVRPLDRWKTPLSEEAVVDISQKLDLPHLPEHVARVRRIAEKNQR